jgi:hypothetical protein
LSFSIFGHFGYYFPADCGSHISTTIDLIETILFFSRLAISDC